MLEETLELCEFRPMLLTGCNVYLIFVCDVLRVREAAMVAVVDVCQQLAGSHPEMAAPHMQQLVCLLVQQANEKIDRTRALACHKLVELLHFK